MWVLSFNKSKSVNSISIIDSDLFSDSDVPFANNPYSLSFGLSKILIGIIESEEGIYFTALSESSTYLPIIVF
jgi:hypothetical protein